MAKHIEAINYVGTAFPPVEGERLADVLFNDKTLDWSSLSIDLRKCPAGLLISAFFNSFLQKIHEESPANLDAAKTIAWETDFPFQKKNVTEWISRFKPQTPA